MKINSDTKISKIIKHNTNAIDVIASINPHFNKLKNPILRKVLAPRVNIKDAARIGKCDVEDFFKALSKIGFEEEQQVTHHQEESQNIQAPDMEEINKEKIKTLDVRPVLEKGVDPFSVIMEAIKKLPDGVTLELINSFEPVPLIKILRGKGYESTVKNEGDVVKTYFIKVATKKETAPQGDEKIYYVSLEKFDSELKSFEGKSKEIDVRDLEMPLPMVTILNELEELEKGTALYIHHKKVPQFLLPELKDKNVTTWISEIEEGNVKLLIHH